MPPDGSLGTRATCDGGLYALRIHTPCGGPAGTEYSRGTYKCCRSYPGMAALPIYDDGSNTTGTAVTPSSQQVRM